MWDLSGGDGATLEDLSGARATREDESGGQGHIRGFSEGVRVTLKDSSGVRGTYPMATGPHQRIYLEARATLEDLSWGSGSR